MRETKYSILLQHEETGRIVDRRFSFADISNGTAKDALDKLKGYAVIARREYVGFHDGKEIYEGDIISLTYARRNKHETHRVYYDEQKACYGPFHHFIDDEERWIDVDYTVEVIGNVWENSEARANVAKEQEYGIHLR